MASKKEAIQRKALQLLEDNKEGLRYSELKKMIHEADGSLNVRTIGTYIYILDQDFPKKVYKPTRGLFRLTQYKPAEEEISEPPEDTLPKLPDVKIKEENFYQPFADWLTNEIEDTTKAIPLGGSAFRDKWGTPDVIGVFTSRDRDLIKRPTEIVAAEIKIDSSQLITAFGQSCAYKLFAHKVHLVVPKQAKQEDISRLDSLCQIFGIGLVTFNNESPEEPDFDIRVRPVRQEPDLYYTNTMLRANDTILKELFPRY
jgi:hypothetical protein